jgi:kinetochore protein NDC80
LREELHTEVEKILNDVIKFKIHVQGRLEEYEEFVSDEVERETEVLQRAEDDLLAEEQQDGDAEVAETMDQSMVDDDERYYD